MTEYRKIKDMEGLTEKTQQTQKPHLIPETKGISNAITTHETEHLKVNIVKQSNLTANCWLIQFNGFEECANCEYFPFNEKNGKLRKTSQCGGGKTLALMIYNKFKGSMADAWKANEFWNNHKGFYGETNYASFVDFIQAMQKEHLWRYPINAYKRHIADLRQIKKEKEQHSARSLDVDFPYFEVIEQAKRTAREGMHYLGGQWQKCDCKEIPKHNSKYQAAYRDETYQFDDDFKTTVYYLHQHAIVATKTFQDHIEIWLDSCGWRTITTRDRINGYLQEIAKNLGLNYEITIYQNKHVWYVDHSTWNGNKWQTLKHTEFYDGIMITCKKP